MNDISIGKFNSDSSGGKYLQGGKYQELKRAYQKFLKQAEKSDMQNSLTFKQKQLELLQQLRKAAIDDSNYADFDMIEDEIEFLQAVVAYEEKHASSETQVDYIPPVQIEKPKTDLASLVNACKNSRGEVDDETRRIVLAFKDSGVTARGLSRFVDKCRGFEEVIPKETVESIEKLRSADVSPNLIFEAVDENPILISNEIAKIDFSWVNDMLTYKSMEIGEADSLKFARRLNSDYENKKEVFSSVVKMLDAGFDVDKTSSIISAFTVKNSETGKANLVTKSVNSVLSMKKLLASSRSVERNERQNPINQQGLLYLTFPTSASIIEECIARMNAGEIDYNQMLSELSIKSKVPRSSLELVIKNNEEALSSEQKTLEQVLGEAFKTSRTAFDGSVMLFKDGKVIETIKPQNTTQKQLTREYADVASELENNIILSFVKQYKAKDGLLDKNALRVFSSLRSAGISYDYILPLVEASLDVIPENKEQGIEKQYDINSDKVKTITTLKKSGALSSDILTIVDSLSKDENGNYSYKDIQTACYLTGLVIAGKEVVELLPEVSQDYQVKDFVTDFSAIVNDRKLLLPLVQLTKDTKGKFDDDAAEVLYSLSERFLLNEEDNMNESAFSVFAEKVISAAKSPVTNNVDENCLNVCIAMCRNNSSSDDILKALELCRDEYEYPNESLADIIWDMSKQGASFEQIVDMINVCKPVNGILDIERAALISDLLDNNCSIAEVVSVAKNLGHN